VNPCAQVKLDLLNGGDTPHELMVKVEMQEVELAAEEQEKAPSPAPPRSMMVHNQAGSFQGMLARSLTVHWPSLLVEL
jgi:hypothetical protein